MGCFSSALAPLMHHCTALQNVFNVQNCFVPVSIGSKNCEILTYSVALEDISKVRLKRAWCERSEVFRHNLKDFYFVENSQNSVRSALSRRADRFSSLEENEGKKKRKKS